LRPAATAVVFLWWVLVVFPSDLLAHPFPLGTVWTDFFEGISVIGLCEGFD
jgi:hypothetical protein